MSKAALLWQMLPYMAKQLHVQGSPALASATVHGQAIAYSRESFGAAAMPGAGSSTMVPQQLLLVDFCVDLIQCLLKANNYTNRHLRRGCRSICSGCDDVASALA